MRKHGRPLALLLLCLLLSVAAASHSAQQERAFVGNKSTKKFHTMQCEWGKKISPKNRVVFHSVAEAEKAGYVACKVCKPNQKSD
jgi:methylphosphotriester-DNA--protein-cysteine methyltransferase